MPRHKILLERHNDKEHLIIYEILGGKPNNKLLPSEQTIADRVPRPAQKGNTCFQYAAHMLRVRCGKHTDSQGTEERIAEAKSSQARKLRSQFYEVEEAYKTLSKLAIDDWNDMALDMIFLKKQITPPFQVTPTIQSIMRDFMKCRNQDKAIQFQHFKQNEIEKSKIEVLEKILKIYGVDPEEEYKRLNGLGYLSKIKLTISDKVVDSRSSQKYSDLNYLDKYAICWMLYNHFETKALKFTHVAWDYPAGNLDSDEMMTLEFKKLMNILNEQGPLLCQGYYGGPYYLDRADNTILEFSIGSAQSAFSQTIELKAQYWESSQRKTPAACKAEGLNSHVVIVVGLHIRGKIKLVYFMDPRDASKPGDPPKIYAMSFKTFCEFGFSKDTLTVFETYGEKGTILAAPPASNHPKLKPKYVGF